MIYNIKLANRLFSIKKSLKIFLAITLDTFLCAFSFWLALYLKFDKFVSLENISYYSFILSIVLPIIVFWSLGLYKTLFRFAGLSIIFIIFWSVSIFTIINLLITSVYEIQGYSISICIIHATLLFVGVCGFRLLIKLILTGNFNDIEKNKNRQNILIYGAGSAGNDILMSLQNNIQYNVVGFIDDNSAKYNRTLNGYRIYNPKQLDSLIKFKDINLILIAIPSIYKEKKKKIIQALLKHKLAIRSLPNINELINKNVSIYDLKDFNEEDLLDREQIEPIKDLLIKDIISKNILVTGAGGTIGSELCRQIVKLKPKRLILLDMNEFFLYKLKDQLINFNKYVEIISILADVKDQNYMEKIFELFKVNTVYHAAAYKHVSIVENNICEGIKNNVFGSLSIIKASFKQKVKNLVIISTDKAVKPTNIMGVSKRLVELCAQAIYNDNKNNDINLSIVRFGNVLNSSGSAVKLFKKQISFGGPVTLTHPEIVRYFMTVSEAAQLVIQAGALGKYSEVFVLDMGKAIKILDVIKRMIHLSGLSIKNQHNKKGDIEIKIIGLKPGEKLYEELLIGDNPRKTIHPKIFKIKEPYIPYNDLKKILDQLLFFVNKRQPEKIKKLLEEKIEFYNSNSEIVDYQFVEENR
jgi:FlaA1/EpsC-like NDP-sugar epimerase